MSPSPNGVARRSQADRTAESREKLVSAAIELLGTRGYAKTTMSEIGRVAQLSRGLVSHHFGTKDQCMVEVVRSIQDRLRGALTAIPDLHGIEVLDYFVDQYLSGGRDYTNLSRAMYVIIVESTTSTPELREAVAANNALFRSLVAGWVREGVEAGDFDLRGYTAEDAGRMVEALLRGVLVQHLADPDTMDLERSGELAKRLIREMFVLPGA